MKKITLALFLAIALLVCFPANAQRYETKEPIPGGEITSDFINYLGQLYKFGIGISAILAVFMIAAGGFIYVVTSAGNAGKMADAKDMIFNAIFGLIIALVAYLALMVINPDLIRGDIKDVVNTDKYLKDTYGH